MAAGARLTVPGVIAMDVSVGAGAATVMAAVADFPDAVAVMVALPAATAVTTPEVLAVAMALADDVNVTPDVRAAVDASLYVPVTVSACVPPIVRLADAGETAIDDSVFAAGVVADDESHPERISPEQTARARNGKCLMERMRLPPETMGSLTVRGENPQSGRDPGRGGT